MTIDEISVALAELKKRLPINQEALDNECRRQSWLLEDVGDLEIHVSSLLKRKKDRLGRIRAGLYLDIRSNPEGFQVGKKPTGPIIDARIEEIDKYSEAVDDMRDIEDLADAIKGVKAVVDTRRSMLHELVKLFVYNYMSGPQDASILSDQMSRDKLADAKEQRIIKLRKKKVEDGTEKGSLDSGKKGDKKS